MTDILAVSCGMQALSAVQQASGEGVKRHRVCIPIETNAKFLK